MNHPSKHSRSRCRRAGLFCLLALTFVQPLGCGGKRLPTEFQRPPASVSLEPDDSGPLARVTERLRPRLGPEQSAFLMLDSGQDALRWRLALIDSARTSLDIKYFFWYPDESGLLLADRVLAAADRGVRVRILLDDVKRKGAESDASEAIIQQHPNIDIKIFNPWMSRAGRMREAFEFAGNTRKLNQRMHNKVFTADGQLTIVGGRNLANHYWGLGDRFNSIDLDLLVAGPLVADVADSFDTYWNHELCYPIEAMGYEVTFEDLAEVDREVDRLVEEAREVLSAFELEPRDWSDRLDPLPNRMIVGRGRVIYDIPATDRGSRPAQIYDYLGETLGRKLQKEFVIASAFFVPQQEFVDGMLEAVDRGIKVKVLTNSLASNPGTVSHAGYKRYRRALLLAGVDLYELRPDAAQKAENETTPRQGHFLGLHTKAFVVDRRYSFVGSLNLDPRAVFVNTEILVMIDSEELAAQVLRVIESSMTPENSWRVVLNDKKKVRWVSDRETLTKEPARGFKQRFTTWAVGVLVPEDWL